MDEKRIAAIFKAFCDENRIRIIKLLRSGEKCACKLLERFKITQPSGGYMTKLRHLTYGIHRQNSFSYGDFVRTGPHV